MKKLTIFLFAVILTGAGCAQSPVNDDSFGDIDNGDVPVEEVTSDTDGTASPDSYDVYACINETIECQNIRVFIIGERVKKVEIDNETMYTDDSFCSSLGCTFEIDDDKWDFAF